VTALTELHLDVRPRLRGWLHTWAALVSVAAGACLISVAAVTRGRLAALATSVYALTVVLLFCTSACYHRLQWSPRRFALMKRLDHSMIFVFIAGSYTPFALLALPGPVGRTLLAVVWTGALAGVALKMAWPAAPRSVGVPLYLGLGWVAVAVLKPLLHGAGLAALVLVLVGGLLYSYGAVVYALRRPDPLPHLFGYHEVFHACTVVAASCHYVAIWFAVFAR
jgi:hemolysin III